MLFPLLCTKTIDKTHPLPFVAGVLLLLASVPDTHKVKGTAVDLYCSLCTGCTAGVVRFCCNKRVPGVVLCLSLLPVNRALATKIQSASTDMMGAKDQRVRVMGQALRSIRVVKMLSWEPACVLAVSLGMCLVGSPLVSLC